MTTCNALKILAEHFQHIYLACGKTDLRKGIDGLVALVETELNLDPYSSALFLFCGSRLDRIKVLLYDGESFVVLYKRLESGKYRWPRDKKDAKLLTEREFAWFCDGLSLEQKNAIKPLSKTNTY